MSSRTQSNGDRPCVVVFQRFATVLVLVVFLLLMSPEDAVLALHGSSSRGNRRRTPFSPPDPELVKIAIAGSSDLQQQRRQSQSIPLGYALSWPVWMATDDGNTVTRINDATTTATGSSGWVNPITFEQLWLPVDLPPPTARSALGLVVKDGQPRYLFPTIETTVSTISSRDDGNDGGGGTRTLWYNRGLNSLPIAKTWLPFNEYVPSIESMRLSSYRCQLLESSSSVTAVDGQKNDWVPVLPMTKVTEALNRLLYVLANGPDELGQGFCYLITPLPSLLPPETVVPGQRIRLFLSNVETIPTSLDPDDDTSWVFNRGECDLTNLQHIAWR